MSVLGIVPARLASSRFPNKPMAEIHSIPMVAHCYFRSKLSASMDQVYVATCDLEIHECIQSMGGDSVMTSPQHERAVDRAAEALTRIESDTGSQFNYVVLIQGDEPMLMPGMLDELVAPIRSRSDLHIINLIEPISSVEDFEDPGIVKVVGSPGGRALYFSREAIPSRKKYEAEVPMWKQLGIILFSREALLTYPTLDVTPLEIIESVDINRFLEHGWPIELVPTAYVTHAVDTPEDLERVIGLMQGDPLLARYRRNLDVDEEGTWKRS